MEDEFVQNECVELLPLSSYIYYLNKILNKIFNIRIRDITIKVSKVGLSTFFLGAMGLNTLEINAATLTYLRKNGNEVILYCFDTWESQYTEWDKLFEGIKPNYIFLAYQQSVDFFKKKYSNVYYLPQCMDKRYFYDRGLHKERLFMQMGRKNSILHERIIEYLANNGISNTDNNYVYEKHKGKIIYESTEELAININTTKYFVCAPQALENHMLTGAVSDVTARFYEAMACKSLIIGYKPKVAFDSLFSPNAMVCFNESASDFEDKIKYFEDNPEEYWKIVNRNYKLVMTEHTWTKRLEAVINLTNKSCDRP